MQRCNSATGHRRSSKWGGRTNRAGFSIWDLLAVILVLGVLIAVITPAMNPSRKHLARQVECLNNIRNLALATNNLATSHDGKLPLLEDGKYGWPVALLPRLDQAALGREIAANPGWSQTDVSIRVFTCPYDSNNYEQPMGLSYVANAEYGNFRVDSKTGRVSEIGMHTADIDWDGDGNIDDADRAVSRATGVFWRSHFDGFRMTLGYISQGDGGTNTIMFAENVNAGNWASRKTMDIAFVIGRDALGFKKQPTELGPLQIQTKSLGVFGISSNHGSLPGRSPSPSSGHYSGKVNVAYCDGHVTSISVDIDPHVFARLMTPNGESFGQAAVEPNDF